MAYKDSDELKTDERYPLGDYSFRIERSSVPGSSNDKIEAICTGKDGKNARKSIQISSNTQFSNWYVEANETTADVYAVVKVPSDESEKTSDIGTAYTGILDYRVPGSYYTRPQIVYTTAPIFVFDSIVYTFSREMGGGYVEKWTWYQDSGVREKDADAVTNRSYEHNGKTAYFGVLSMLGNRQLLVDPTPSSGGQAGAIAWTALYGESGGTEYEEKIVLVGRFAIEIEEAGGVGPGGGIGGGWEDPEDYDEDWEEGDPTHTLYVTVTGALSGRHNDPIEDPSYSYIPADKDTVKDYGCGGDGGHGGGGGAGASTVVIHKFATNQANSKEVTAIARRHGYGSGGGKGGKGGDGCILVYY